MLLPCLLLRQLFDPQIINQKNQSNNQITNGLVGFPETTESITDSLEKFTLEVKEVTGDNPERQNEFIQYITQDLKKIYEELLSILFIIS